MPNTNPATTTIETLEKKHEIANQNAIINCYFFIGATPDNLSELQKADMAIGIKLFLGSSTGSLLVDQENALENIFQNTSHIIAVHAENETMIKQNTEKYSNSKNILDHLRIRPEEAALSATKQIITLATKYRHPTHLCHITTKSEIDYLTSIKSPFITAEVTPQHLCLHAPDVYNTFDTLAQINPPIREQHHQEALWQGLKNNTITCIGTDHAPHTLEEKNQPFPNAPSGMPGLETALPLMLNAVNNQKCTLIDISNWMSKNVAKTYKLKHKGQLSVGYDGDLTIIDLKTTKTVQNKKLQTKCKWSIFDQVSLQGWPIITIVNGQPIFREGDILV